MLSRPAPQPVLPDDELAQLPMLPARARKAVENSLRGDDANGLSSYDPAGNSADHRIALLPVKVVKGLEMERS
jgi:hypothetical protein